MEKNNESKSGGESYLAQIQEITKDFPKETIRPFPYLTSMINPEYTEACIKILDLMEEFANKETQNLKQKNTNYQTKISELEKSETKLLNRERELDDIIGELKPQNKDYKLRLENIAQQIPEDLKTQN